jgi:O-antigen/teichoic acid export membrane protein
MTGLARVQAARAGVLAAAARRRLDRLPAGFRQVAANASWLAMAQAVRMVVGLLVGVYVARHLGPAAFGVLNYSISFVFLFSALSRLGLDNLVVRDLVACPEREAETISAALTLRLTGGTLALGLIAAAAWSLETDPVTRLAILIIASGLILQSLEVTALWFYAKTFSRPVVVARLLALALISALRIAFILLDKPVLWFAVPVALDAALAAVLMLAFYSRDSSAPPLRLPAPLGRTAALLKEGWPLALSMVLIETQLRIGQVMLGAMLGPRQVGWYAAATRPSQMLYVIPTLLATATFPSIVHARATSQAVYDRHMQAFYDLMLWLGIAVALPGSFLAGPVIQVLYGDAYGPAATILRIHIWSFAFLCVGTTRSRWLFAEGLTRFILPTALVAVATNIGCNALLIPTYGGAGAAWATLLAQLTSLLVISLVYPRTRQAGLLTAAALLAPVRRLRSMQRHG